MKDMCFIDLSEITYLSFRVRDWDEESGNYVVARFKDGFEISYEGKVADKLFKQYLEFKKCDSIITLCDGDIAL